MNEPSVTMDKKSMYSILNALTDIFRDAIQKAFPQVPQAPVVITSSSNAKFGDYQCNSAMPIMQLLKSEGRQIFIVILQLFMLAV